MKRYLFIIAVFISADLYSTGNITNLIDNHKLRMDQLKNELFTNLTQNLLPYWSTKMIDNLNGGFYGRIDAKDRVYPDEDKGGILNARILWTFSSAYRVLKDTAYLGLVTRSKDYIMAHFIDKQYGGAFLTVKSNGEPSDTRKQIYTQSFFIYGLAEYYRVTGDKEALITAKEIFGLIEKNAMDMRSGGYFEVFSRDWNRIHDLLIGEKSIADEKTMNTHLHLMEAYTNLYRVWPDRKVADRLKSLVELFLDKIIDAKTCHLICFMDKHWNRTSNMDSYGHDIESSWLLVEAAVLLGDGALLKRAQEASIKIANAAAEGLQADGSIIYEKDFSTGSSNKERSWWAQAKQLWDTLMHTS